MFLAEAKGLAPCYATWMASKECWDLQDPCVANAPQQSISCSATCVLDDAPHMRIAESQLSETNFVPLGGHRVFSARDSARTHHLKQGWIHNHYINTMLRVRAPFGLGWVDGRRTSWACDPLPR